MTAGDYLLDVQSVRRIYPDPAERGGRRVAVDGIDVRLRPEEAVALVGESGSGKSTLVRLVLALEQPDGGRVFFDGIDISAMTETQLRPLRRRFQAVFQDPIGSLDPRLTVKTIVAEPLCAYGIGTAAERRDRVRGLLEQVGLPADALRRLPAAFSGGERQRIAIARALALEPELLVLDEPVSSLDASIQAQILGLLSDLRRRRPLTMLLVSHDLDVVRRVCDRVLVMYRGKIVEEGPIGTVLEHPRHPYTRALLDAAPEPDPDWRPPPPPPIDGGDWPAGSCRYAPHCPRADQQCHDEPDLDEIGPGRRVACWHQDG